MYFNKEIIYERLKKHYTNGDIFRAYILNDDIFPLVLKLKKIQQKDIQNNYLQIVKEIDLLNSELEELREEKLKQKSELNRIRHLTIIETNHLEKLKGVRIRSDL